MKTAARMEGSADRAYDRYMKDLRRLPGARPAPARTGPRSRNDLVESHLFYVVRVAREYTFTRIPIEDLLSEGNLGLIEAAARFDATRGTRFITYASWWIRKRILNLIARQITLIRLPKYKVARLRRMRQAEQELAMKLNRQPSEDEICEAAGFSHEEIAALRLAGQGAVSIESVALEDGSRLEERLGPEEESADAEEEAVGADLAHQLHRLMAALPVNERFVLSYRFGFHAGEGETLESIAHRMGVSRERVRQIERQGLERIRRALARQTPAAPSGGNGPVRRILPL